MPYDFSEFVPFATFSAHAGTKKTYFGADSCNGNDYNCNSQNLRIVIVHLHAPAPPPVPLPTRELALVLRQGVDAVWTDGSGRHSSNPHFRRCGVGYVTDAGERVCLPPAWLQPA
eukprot:6475883-Amphidinium_carterae.1